MADQKSDKIALIIIDQLRRDYEPYFTKCRKLLSYCTTCDTNSIPASTEAMHTNISVGKYPVEHGVISKKSKDGNDIEELVRKFFSKEIIPLASVGFNKGYKTFCAGGKSAVVNIMSLPLESELRVFAVRYPDQKWEIKSDNETGSYWESAYKSWKAEQPAHIYSPTELDASILDLFGKILAADKASDNKFFYILALSGLDTIGHDWGPHSDKVLSHIASLDEKIAKLIDANKNHLFIIAGDHGCRRTDRYVIQLDENMPREAGICHREGDIYKPVCHFMFDSENKLQYLSYDGGKFRIWLDKGVALSQKDAELLSRYGTIIDLRSETINVDLRFLEAIENSRHNNAGHILVVSKEDSTFCKRAWVKKAETIEKIRNQKELQLLELPIGEHGTYYDADRLTLFMSNHDFGKEKLFNLQIREEIEKVML